MIVIVGAGLAGLSAAWKLVQMKYNDFVVVEAQDRVGGRVQSVYTHDSCRLDLGAHWLHGEKSNPVYKWLKSLDCIEGLDDEEVEFEGLFATQRGEEASQAVTARVLEVILEVKKQLYSLSKLVSDEANCKRPVDIFRDCVQFEILKCPTLQSADKNLITAVERWFELYEMIDNSCQRLDALSIKAYSEWSDFDDGQLVKLKGGWQSVVDKMIEFIGKEKVLLNSVVKQINYSSDRVMIILEDDTQLNCEHVIVTMSLGVIKNLIKTDFFKPPLEQSTANGIDLCGFGPANKIFLRFDQPILKDLRGLKFLWLEGTGYENDSWEMRLPKWAKYLTGFDVVDDTRYWLLGWVGGQGAAELENFSDEEVGKVCYNMIKKFLPASKQTKDAKLISIIRSSWCTNVFVQGAYSYPSIEAINQNTTIDGLWKPIYGDEEPVEVERNESAPLNSSKRVVKVLFAGEATADKMYATAHGAIVSGWREADRLLKLMNLSKNGEA